MTRSGSFPIDPATGEFVRNDDGSPRWQRNILYYGVVPSNLNVQHSGGGIGDGGYEVSYPYKFLVRKVIDSGLIADIPISSGPANIAYRG